MSDPAAGVDLVDVGVQAAGAGGGFAAVWLTVRWLIVYVTGRIDRRQELLDQQEARADQEWKAIREELKDEIASLRRRDEQRERESQALRLAFEIVANVVRRADPDNPELGRAEQLLAAAYPLDVMTPRDMVTRVSQAI